MEPARARAEQLREHIRKAENELQALREQLAQVEAEQDNPEAPTQSPPPPETAAWKWPLKAQEYERYGRQLILPHVGIHGKMSL